MWPRGREKEQGGILCSLLASHEDEGAVWCAGVFLMAGEAGGACFRDYISTKELFEASVVP